MAACCHRLQHVAPLFDGQRQRNEADQDGDGGHDAGTQADLGRLHDRHGGVQPLPVPEFVGEGQVQDTVIDRGGDDDQNPADDRGAQRQAAEEQNKDQVVRPSVKSGSLKTMSPRERSLSKTPNSPL